MLAKNFRNDIDPEKNYEMAIMNTRNSKINWFCLSMSCPGIQTRELVKTILDNYPQDMLVDSWLTLTWSIEQSLRILNRIKQTFICFDYKWAKSRVMLDMSKTKIIPEKWAISIFGNKELASLSKFIIDNTWDIHLLNWILRVEVEPWRKDWGFVFKAKKYYSSCDRAKRENLRVELNWNAFAKQYFKNIKKWSKLAESDYLVTTEGGIGIWIVKNISDKWLWIFVPKFLKPLIESKASITLVLSLFNNSIKINLNIKKITTIEEGNYCEIWWTIWYLWNENERKINKNLITKFVWWMNKKIWEEFNAFKDWYEPIEKIEIKPKEL